MREILFRGKTLNEEWVEGAYYHQTEFYGDSCDDHYIITSTDELEDNMMNVRMVISETVGQYTGLTDNGKKIFEGDIINIVYEPSSPTVINLVVEYIGASFYGSNDFDNWELDNFSQIEVIGNIHDNPELLGGDYCG